MTLESFECMMNAVGLRESSVVSEVDIFDTNLVLNHKELEKILSLIRQPLVGTFKKFNDIRQSLQQDAIFEYISRHIASS